MRYLIVGCGTTGGMIGARLIERGADVTFLVRPARKAQLVTVGLMLMSPFGRFRRRVLAITPDQLACIYDVVVIATRSQDYKATLTLVRSAIGPGTAVLPVVEGADHLDFAVIPNGGRPFGAVLEARTTMDADAVLTQRLPTAELQIGAVHTADATKAVVLASAMSGRGLSTFVSDRIMAAIWERYCFVASAAAVNALTRLSLRDAIRPTHNFTVLDRLLNEGVRIGEASGLAPRAERVLAYRRGFRLETRPVQAPALMTTPGRGADEAVYLLLSMNAFAQRAGVPAPVFLRARHAVVRRSEMDLPAGDI